jgi:hypothetical protein
VTGRKRLRLLTEKAGRRAQVWALLLETVKSHYEHLDRIAGDAARLGLVAPLETPTAFLLHFASWIAGLDYIAGPPPRRSASLQTSLFRP